MQPAPSTKLIIALCKFYDYLLNHRKLKISGFFQKRLIFLHNNPTNADPIEAELINEIKRATTDIEWTNLDNILSQYTNSIKELAPFWSTLNSLFEKDNLDGAQKYVNNFPGQVVREIYTEELRNYLRNKVSDYEDSLAHNNFQIASSILKQIERFLPKNTKEELLDLKLIKEGELIELIRKACKAYDFSLAYEIYEKINHVFSHDDFDKLILTAKQQQEVEKSVTETKEKVLDLLARYEFDSANSLHNTIEKYYPIDDFNSLLNHYKQQKRKEEKTNHLKMLINSHQFSQADKEFLSTDLFNYESYMALKAPAVQTAMNERYSIQLNLEQASAISQIGSDILIKARAGSGKTRVITSKVAYLIDFEKVNPDNVLVLAFNKKAALEVKKRINELTAIQCFNNSSTFHSLAYRLVQPEKEILFDEKKTDLDKKQSKIIQKILLNLLEDKQFLTRIYEFLRGEINELKEYGLDLNPEDQFNFRRGLLQFSLQGERVYSKRSKFIADFLFEHDVDYKFYGKNFKKGKLNYRAPFYFIANDEEFIIEDWEEDPIAWDFVPSINNREVNDLRDYCRDNSIYLIETCKIDLNQFSREEFEFILEDKLRFYGFSPSKLDQHTLEEKVKSNDRIISRLSQTLTQFIQRAKKQSITPQMLEKLIENYHTTNGRENAFIKLALKVFNSYEEKKNTEGVIDFEDLLTLAIEKIKNTKGNCQIKSKESSIKIKDLVWILIDEFQDYSELFSKLITEIRNYNQSVQLFCVGDDWQAINGFAGSDLKFFKCFPNNGNDSIVANLLSNFRSKSAIVSLGNKLMNGFGEPASSLPNIGNGEVFLLDIDDVQIDFNAPACIDGKRQENAFLIPKKVPGSLKHNNQAILVTASKYLKLCYYIATNMRNLGKKIAILSRTSQIAGVDIAKFKNHLDKWIAYNEEIKPDIDVSTIHSFKGLEAEVVILIEVIATMFPLLHPDNSLFTILGRTKEDCIEEERRLFYVGITRAKSGLYILSEKSRISPYLQYDLNLTPTKPKAIFSRILTSDNKAENSESYPNDEDIPF